MSILVSNIRLSLDDDENYAVEKAAKIVGVRYHQIETANIYKKSIDARHQNNISFVVSVIINLRNADIEEKVASRSKNATVLSENTPILAHGDEICKTPIVIVGFGPAGIFAAHLLAKEGYNPIVFERGGDIDDRKESVTDFWNIAYFDKETNVQFGEGGAGAFSDGKLTTRINDKWCRYILQRFAKNKAPKDILMNAKPHIGTDILCDVIKSLRHEIISDGAKIYFNKKVERINIRNGRVKSVTVSGQEIATERVILAIGHSARDTFSMLFEEGVEIHPKNFSVGVRIEHRQSMINKALYGKFAEHPNIPQGEYQLSYKNNDRCVYTFCMCPGGHVIAANSEENSIVTNGMSYHGRGGANSNSALVVSVSPFDFGNHPFDGIKFQREFEHKAFEMAGADYSAPVSLVGEFLDGGISKCYRTVLPTYPIKTTFVDLHTLYPQYITDIMKQGIYKFNAKVNGFAHKDAVLTAPETRTSSPIRILRDDFSYNSVNVKGLYPCGEGAGYAGGIMSAAADGLRIAEKIISKYKEH